MFNSFSSLSLPSSNLFALCDCGERVPVVRSGWRGYIYLLLPVCETQNERSASGAIRCSDQPVGVWRAHCGQLYPVPHLHFRLLHDKRSPSTIRAQREPLRPDGKRVPTLSVPAVCSSTPTGGATVLPALHELRSSPRTQHANGPCILGCPSCVWAGARPRAAFSSGTNAHGAHLSLCHYLIMLIKLQMDYKTVWDCTRNRNVSGILSFCCLGWLPQTCSVSTNKITTDMLMLVMVGTFLWCIDTSHRSVFAWTLDCLLCNHWLYCYL